MTDEDQRRVMIDDCVARESRLTDWERSFIYSVAAQERPLSARQAETLEAIWDRATAKG